MSEVKFFLQQLSFLNEEIEALQSECELIKATIYSKEKVVETNVVNSGDQIMRLMNTHELINEKVDELIDLKIQVSNEIDYIDDRKFRIILRERYINMRSWEYIAGKLTYEVRHIHRLHGNALIAFEQVHKVPNKNMS